MTDVFVSYKRENLTAVGRLVEALRAEGIGVWWDQDIPPNAAWEATIEAALAAAKLVIVAWSPAAVASDNVKAEARWARGQGRLLQVFVEPCEPPLFFGERQGVDLNGWAGAASDAAFQALLAAVRAGLGSAPAPSIEPILLTDTAPPPLPSKPSIAVLPFANLSGDPEQEYFADGMVVEIVEALSRSPSIFVIAAGSSLAFKGKGVGAREAAQRLGVRYVLEGNVRKAGGRVRIGVQLIDASSDAQIWTHRFEDTLEDVFDLQDKVALAVAGKIEPTLQSAEIRRASTRPTEDVGSYDLYLRALPPYRTYSRKGMLAAIELLDQAIALDPDNGQALGAAAMGNMLISTWGWASDDEVQMRRAVDLARRSIRAAGDDANVLANAAHAIRAGGDDDAGLALTDRAVALNPGSAAAWQQSGIMRVILGHYETGAEHLETAMRLDPLGPTRMAQLAWLGMTRFVQGLFHETVQLEREVMQQTGYPLGLALLAMSYGHLGQTADARDALERYRAASPVPLDRLWPRFVRDPAALKLLLDGIALAEGKSPSVAATDSQ